MYLALAALCVPVIVQPLVAQAYHQLLPYDEFAIFIKASKLEGARAWRLLPALSRLDSMCACTQGLNFSSADLAC